MAEVKFVDTSLRDGQASLWAENMRTGMMLVVADRLDNAGYRAIELIASSHIKKCVRELREDPFERMRLVADDVMENRVTVTDPEYLTGPWTWTWAYRRWPEYRIQEYVCENNRYFRDPEQGYQRLRVE